MSKSVVVILVGLMVVGAAILIVMVVVTSKRVGGLSVEKPNDKQVEWQYDSNNKQWRATGIPPKCMEPLVFGAPVDVSLASGILYPGQVRGGDYKAHGGFRFDGLKDNQVNVYAPMDAKVVEAAWHPSMGEYQYVLYFLDDCGIMYKLDHLRELTPKFEAIIKSIPMGGENDTRTTRVRPSISVNKGELVATKVGLEKDKNVFFDFGVYDLRRNNGVNYSSSKYFNIEQYGGHALCWLDYLEERDKSIVKSLPGADGQSGKQSDYCRL